MHIEYLHSRLHTNGEFSIRLSQKNTFTLIFTGKMVWDDERDARKLSWTFWRVKRKRQKSKRVHENKASTITSWMWANQNQKNKKKSWRKIMRSKTSAAPLSQGALQWSVWAMQKGACVHMFFHIFCCFFVPFFVLSFSSSSRFTITLNVKLNDVLRFSEIFTWTYEYPCRGWAIQTATITSTATHVDLLDTWESTKTILKL